MNTADVTYTEAVEILQHAASRVIAAPRSVFDTFEQNKRSSMYLPCGIQSLDGLMNGGIICRTLSEVCGPPGVGKSQFCASVCVQMLMQQPSSLCGILYIDTELKFQPSRIKEIATGRYPEQFSEAYTSTALHAIDDMMKHITVLRPLSCKDLQSTIESIQEMVISKHIKLVRVLCTVICRF